VSGTAIIMSLNNIKLLIENKDQIDMSVIDDVSLGVFFNKTHNIIPETLGPRNAFVFNYLNTVESAIFYRNRRSDRSLDSRFMNRIVNSIINRDPNYSQNKIIVKDKIAGNVYYGRNNEYFDVTNTFKEFFDTSMIKGDKIEIPTNIRFNDVFGDPCVGVAKHLVICTSTENHEIDEYRKNDMAIII